jgi:NAD(P)H-flavin reductase
MASPRSISLTGVTVDEVLRRYAPPDLARWSALACGPPAMVAEAAVTLQRLGMPQAAIQAEGFE